MRLGAFAPGRGSAFSLMHSRNYIDGGLVLLATHFIAVWSRFQD
jgi:hypothetical protein